MNNFLWLCAVCTIALKCTIDTTQAPNCTCLCKDEAGDAVDPVDDKCTFTNICTDFSDKNLEIYTDGTSIELTSITIETETTSADEITSETQKTYTPVPKINKLKISQFSPKIDPLKELTITNTLKDGVDRLVIFENTEIASTYSIVYISLGSVSHIDFKNSFGYIKDNYKYIVTSLKTDLFLIGPKGLTFYSLPEPIPNVVITETYVRYSTTAGPEKTCTLNEEGGLDEFECEMLESYSQMILKVNQPIFVSSPKTAKNWLEVDFNAENVQISGDSATNPVSATILRIKGIFQISGGLTKFSDFYMKTSISNKITSEVFAPENIDITDSVVSPMVFFLSSTKTTAKYSGSNLYSRKISTNFYSITNEEQNIYCTINADGNAFEEPDCIDGILDDGNELTLKYNGVSDTLPIISNHLKFVTFLFDSTKKIKTIHNYVFTTLTVTHENIYLTNVTINAIELKDTFVYGTLYESSISTLSITGSGYIVHDATSYTSKLNRISDTLYREMSGNNELKLKCVLNCDDTKCSFEQQDCESLADSTYMTLVAKSGLANIDSIPGANIKTFAECDFSLALPLTLQTGVELTCNKLNNGASNLIIKSGFLKIVNMYTSTSFKLSVLYNLPLNYVISLKFVWVKNEQIETEYCVKANSEFARCSRTVNSDLLMDRCEYQTSYNFIDCDQTQDYHVDFEMIKLYLKGPTTSDAFQMGKVFNVEYLFLGSESCTFTTSSITVTTTLDVSTCTSLNITLLNNEALNVIPNTKLYGILSTSNKFSLSTTTIPADSLPTLSSTVETISINKGNTAVQWWYTQEAKCSITGTNVDFNLRDVCYSILNFTSIDIELTTTGTILETSRTFKTISNLNSLNRIDQPNLQLLSLNIVTADKEFTLKSVETLTLGAKTTINIQNVDLLTVNSDGCKVSIGSLTKKIVFGNEGIFFNGMITTETVVETEVATVSSQFKRYGTTSLLCSSISDSQFTEFDCNDQTRVDYTFMTLQVGFSSSQIDQQFKKCIINGDGYSVSNIKCTTTEITANTFTLTNCQLGTLAINKVDNINRKMTGSKMNITDLSAQIPDIPVFYSDMLITIGDSAQYLTAQKVTDTHYRYFGTKTTNTACVYNNTGYNIVDCNTDASIGLDLTISSNNFRNIDHIFKSAFITTDVTVINALKATKFSPVFTESLTINGLQVTTLKLPTTYKSLEILSTNLESTITEIENGAVPLFVGKVTVNSPNVHNSVINAQFNRYYIETLGLDCNCEDGTSVIEWDCINTYDLSVRTFKCTKENEFTFGETFSDKFKTIEVSSNIILNNINCDTLKIMSPSYTIKSGVAKTISIGIKHLDGTFTGSFNTITSTSDTFNLDLMHYLKNQENDKLPTLEIPTSSLTVHFVLLSTDKLKYRVSTVDALYCTYTSEDTTTQEAQYLEGDCSTPVDTQILKIDSTKPTKTTLFAKSGMRTFASLMTAQSTLELPTVSLTSLTGNGLDTKIPMTYTLGHVETFTPISQLSFSIKSNVKSISFSEQSPDAYIEGSVETVSTTNSFDSTHLFVLKSTAPPKSTLFTTKIATDTYRVSSKADTNGSNKICTLSTDTTKFDEFDCNKYSVNGENQLNLVSTNVIIDLTGLHLQNFESAELLGATSITDLTVSLHLNTGMIDVTFITCNISTLQIKDEIIAQYFFIDSLVITHNATNNPIFVFDEKSYTKFTPLASTSNLKTTQISTDTPYYRVRKTAVDQICTAVDSTALYSEWDCNKYAQTNPTNALMNLKISGNQVQISSKILHFKDITFNGVESVEYILTISDSTKLWIDSVSFASTTANVYYNLDMKITTLTIAETIAFTIFGGNLELTNPPSGSSTSNFIALISNGKTLTGNSNLNTIKIGSESTYRYSRISKATTLDCTYISATNKFKELDCLITTSESSLYNFVSSNFNLVFTDTTVDFNNNAIVFSTMKYPTDSTTHMFALTTQKTLTFNVLIIKDLVNINNFITINNEIDFDQSSNYDFTSRSLSLNFISSVILKVKTSSSTDYTTDPGSNSYPLFTGTQTGIKPEWLNKQGCSDKAQVTYSLKVVQSVSEVKVLRTVTYSDLAFESSQITFTNPTLDTPIEITFKLLTIEKPIIFGNGVSVRIEAYTFTEGSNGFLQLDSTQGIVLPTTIPSYAIIISAMQLTSLTTAVKCQISEDVTRYVIKNGITNGCECWNQLADCAVPQYSLSKYYLKISQNVDLTSSFSSIQITGLTPQSLISISSVTLQTIKTLDISSVSNLRQLNIKGATQVESFINKDIYTIFENKLPKQVESLSTVDYKYGFNSLLSPISLSTMKAIDCGNPSSHFYRNMIGATDATCECKYSTPLVDCPFTPINFNLNLDVPDTSTSKFTLSNVWKNVLLSHTTETNTKDEIVLAVSGNIFIVGSNNFKLSSTLTQKPTATAEFKSENTAYIETTGILLSIAATSQNTNYPLFVSTDDYGSGNYQKCNSVYRHFSTGVTKNCDCIYSESGLSSKDCVFQSTNYNLKTTLSTITLNYNWSSFETPITSSLFNLHMNSKYISTIKIKCPTNIDGIVTQKGTIVTDGTNYLTISTTGTEFDIPVDQCNTYCATYQDSVTTHPNTASCGTNNQRVSNNNQCYCTINTAGNSFSETDCNHDESLVGYDLKVNNENQQLRLTKTLSFNKLTLTPPTQVIFTSTNSISFKLIDVNIPITFNMQVTIIEMLNQIRANTIKFLKTTTITSVTPLTNGFILFDTDSSNTLTINAVSDSVQSCLDFAYSNHQNINSGSLKQVKLNGKTTLRTSSCVDNKALECYFTKENENYDEQFSTLNCPCDAVIGSETTTVPCVLHAQSIVEGKTFKMQHNIEAEFKIESNIIFSSTSSFTIKNVTFTGTTLSFKDSKDITIKNFTVTRAVTISGNINIENQFGNVAATLQNNNKIVTLQQFNFASIYSSSSYEYILTGTALGYSLICKRCTIRGTNQKITSLTIGDSNLYQFEKESTTNISKIVFNANGDFELLQIDGKVNFDSTVLQEDFKFSYPIVISKLNNNTSVTTQSQAVKVLCNNMVTIANDFSHSQFCESNDYQEDNEFDDINNCNKNSYCTLTIKSKNETKISKNYNVVTCNDECTITSFDSKVTKLNIKGTGSNIITIKVSPTFQVRAQDCILNVETDLRLSAKSVAITRTTGTVTLVDSTLKKLDAVNVVITGEVTIEGEASISNSLTLSSGSLTCKSLTVKMMIVPNNKFGALTTGTFTLSSGGSINAPNYYNYYSTTYTGCSPNDGILTAGRTYDITNLRCVTLVDRQIDLNSLNAYQSHVNMKCNEFTIPILVKSTTVSVSKQTTINTGVFVSTATKFIGNYILKNFTTNSEVIFTDHINVVCSSQIVTTGTIKIIGNGEVHNCPIVIQASTNDILIDQVSSIELSNTGVFTMSSGIQSMTLIISKEEFDRTITLDKEIKTLTILDETTKQADHVLLVNTISITGGALGDKYKFVCNNKKVVSNNSQNFSCDDFSYSIEYQDTSAAYTPTQGCLNSYDINCIAKVTVLPGSTLTSLNLVGINSQTVILYLKAPKVLRVNLDTDVQNFTIVGNGETYGVVLPALLPKYTTVNNALLTVENSGSQITIKHVVYLKADETSTIELNNLKVNIWELKCSKVTLNGITGAVYSPITVDSMKVTNTQLEVYDSIDINTLNVDKTAQDVAVFTAKQNIEMINIEEGIPLTSLDCKYIVDYQLASVKPILSDYIKLNNFSSYGRIFTGVCSFKLDNCSILPTTKCTVDVHESGNYQFISLCPNSSIPIVLSKAICEDSKEIAINGISDKSYNKFILPENAVLQSSATSSIEIKTLDMQQTVTFLSPYIIKTLQSSVDTTVVINCKANTQIETLVLSKPVNITISQGSALTLSSQKVTSYEIAKLEIGGNDLSVYGLTANIVVTDLVFEATSSDNSIIKVNTLDLSKINTIEFKSGVRTSHIPLINTVEKMTIPTQMFTDTSLVCDGKTLIYKYVDNKGESTAFQCPDNVKCIMQDNTQCIRSLTQTDYIQKHVIDIPNTFNGNSIQLGDNSQVTKIYDVVNVNKPDLNIQVEKGGIYVFNIYAKGIQISCAETGSTTDSICHIIINNLNVDFNEVVLSGKNMELKEDITIDNLVANVAISGDITLSSFEVTSLTIRVKDGGIMRVKQYASMKSLTLEKGSTVYSSDSFDTDEVIYNGGQIIIDADNTEAVLNVNIFNIVAGSIDIPSNGCLNVINRKKLKDLTQEVVIPELVWKGKVVFDNQGEMVTKDCGYSKLDICANKDVENECENIECSPTDGDTRQICFCTYDPAIKQDCSLACPITENTDCVFEPLQTSTALFNKITIPTTNTLVINKLFKFFVMKMSQNINIRATKSLNIYQITDEGENGAGTIAIDSSADITIDSIRLTQSSSILTIKANALTTQELYVINGATLNINSEVTLPTSQSGFEFDTNLTNVPSVTRQIYFGKDAKINLLENAYFTIQGPTTKDQITNKFDATYNKMTLDECTVTLDADYIGKVTKNYPNVVFNFEVIGEVIINKATVMYKDKAPSDKNVTLILNNDVSHITTTEFSTKNVIDDQNYALIVGQSNAVLDKTAIPELSCDLTSEFSGKVSSETKWKRSQCPCNGETCIVNTESVVNTVNYEVTNITFAKYYTTNGLLEGTSANISELISLGGTTEVKVTNSNIEMVTMEKRGIISFTKPMKVPIINGLEESGTIDVKTHSLTTKSITNVDLSISTGSILLEKETTGNFNGRTITVAASGRLDIYSSKIIFDDKTNFNVKVEAGQPALISVDDDAVGDTLSITNAHYKVTIPSGSSGKIFTVLRVLTPINIANFEFTEDPTTPGGSVKTQLKSGTFAFKEACNGVVLTDLPNEQITCPEDRMARVVEKFEFPMYMIAVIIIFVLVLAVIVALLIAYVVHVYIVRKRNMKVFEEGEEIAVDENKQDEEIKNEDNKPTNNEVKRENVIAPVPSEVPLANDQKKTSVLDKTSESGSGSNSGSNKD
ncbi:hypothetical protein EIN_327210 [Entamoeba invadens IP1]|uniref:Uncharacterized protein n=1 Tax=Entamoeba invadens IP1 TaxID=370355 RepID=A0A0A1TXJ7_ENTIV|nr:hypothetical protein EIN_327210 [Entamoeba invadens IP1]ELP86074.1 hypothetical protein EIN_327210 [Entamoeba invadens IP1]|eukprot:XP_004185420.1 hypothetical protein EIN_327210 [Entamoeba invadens IP1]